MNKQRNMVYFQRLSRAFLMPIALLSVASLMLGVASIFLWHDQLREMFPILTSAPVQYFAQLLNTISNVVMGNLPLLYCVSISFAMAHEEKAYAAFGALTGYIAFILGMNFLITINPDLATSMPAGTITTILGIETVNTGILGAIFVGLFSAAIHNKVYNIKLPMAFAFFGGVRFVAIATSVVFVIVGQLVPFVWVYISSAINTVAYAVASSDVFGPFFYQFGERLLIPTGTHQIWNTVIRDTAVSGIYVFPDPYGTIEGARGAYNAYMATGIVPEGHTLEGMVKFLRGGQMPITIFGVPAMAYAIYKTAKPENRKNIKALLIAAVSTSMIAGVTEPIEFSFLFVAPMLYLIYAVICGAAYSAVYVLGSAVGGTEANVLGLAIFGFLRGESNWWVIFVVGIVVAILLYVIFKWYIEKFDVKTPGRGGDYDNQLDMLDGIVDVNKEDPLVLKAQLIIKGLGGVDNIKTVDACMSRLRITLENTSLYDEKVIDATGCNGVVRPSDNDIQIIYGTTVGSIKNAVQKEIKRVKGK